MDVRRRIKTASVHLVASAGVAAAAAGAIFLLWFPTPFQIIAGGLELFVLVMSVDVIAGPALTFVAASPAKPSKELRRDLTVIVVVQLCALSYGLYAVALARPVLVAFEVDRLRVVSAAEIDSSSLDKAPEGLRALSWTGPRYLAAVKPTHPDDTFRSLELGLAGVDLSMDPRNWRPYETEADAAWLAAKPLQRLLDKYPAAAPEAARIAASAKQPMASLRYLPLQARRMVWTGVLAEPGARIVGYLPVDGFL